MSNEDVEDEEDEEDDVSVSFSSFVSLLSFSSSVCSSVWPFLPFFLPPFTAFFVVSSCSLVSIAFVLVDAEDDEEEADEDDEDDVVVVLLLLVGLFSTFGMSVSKRWVTNDTKCCER